MTSNSNNTIWRPASKKERVILFTLGAAFFFSSVYFFNLLINQPLIDNRNILWILILPEFEILGMIFIFINFNSENSYVKTGLAVVSGIVIGGLIFNSPVRYMTLIILIDIIIFVIVTYFADSFVTAITLSLYSIAWIIIATIFVGSMPNYFYAIVYSCITLCLVTYLFFGCCLNKKVLNHMWGEYKAKNYNYRTLKDNLILIYIIIFVMMNVSTALYSSDSNIYNLINNCFLTVVTILSVDWRKIFHIKNKKRTN